MGDTTNLYANNSNQSTGVAPKNYSTNTKYQKLFFFVMLCLLGVCLILGIVVLRKHQLLAGWIILSASTFGMAFCCKCLYGLRVMTVKATKANGIPRIFKIWYKQRCYKKINTLHDYLKSGSITQDEFQKLKNEILQSIQ